MFKPLATLLRGTVVGIIEHKRLILFCRRLHHAISFAGYQLRFSAYIHASINSSQTALEVSIQNYTRATEASFNIFLGIDEFKFGGALKAWGLRSGWHSP